MIFTVGKAVKYENVLMEDCVNWLFGDRVGLDLVGDIACSFIQGSLLYCVIG